MIDALVRDGTVTLLALAVLGLELVLLLLVARQRMGALSIVANGLSGVFLILALRAALLGSGSAAVALWLGLGFLAHVSDLALRLRRKTS